MTDRPPSDGDGSRWSVHRWLVDLAPALEPLRRNLGGEFKRPSTPRARSTATFHWYRNKSHDVGMARLGVWSGVAKRSGDMSLERLCWAATGAMTTSFIPEVAVCRNCSGAG